MSIKFIHTENLNDDYTKPAIATDKDGGEWESMDRIKWTKRGNQNMNDILWMARRYADGRSTYVTNTINQLIDQIIRQGGTITRDETLIDPEGMYASDGMFGFWRDGKWEKQPNIRETILEWQKWCVDNQCDINPFCTQATNKLEELIKKNKL